MCIVLHKPDGISLSEQTYRNCFNSNSDGAGFAFAENGKIVYFKGYFDFNSFWQAYLPHAERETIVHFRIATHGATDIANCHPWLVTGCAKDFEFAVAHNGILTYDSSPEMSDTGHFVQEILGPILKRDPWFLDHEAGRYLLEQTIGSYNKFVILRSDGKVYILNRHAGVIDTNTNTWFSNDGFRDRMGFMGGWPDHDEHWPSYIRNNYGRSSACDYAPLHQDRTDPPHSKEVVVVPTRKVILPNRSVVTKPSGTALPHLNRRMRKQIYKLAAVQFGGSGMGPTEMVRALRDMFQDDFPDRASLPDDLLDREILKLNYDGWTSAPNTTKPIAPLMIH